MRREKFTIGWICALAHELSASVAMLDEELDPLVLDGRDQNTYTYGRIGGHYIVLACLPAGEYGIGAAASAAQDMRRSFNLRFCLLVGIGGGIWSPEHDVRLGDVVVSQPAGTNGGVIQYDLGKILPNGVFERKGFLNSPPRVLLNAMHSLQALHERKGSAISAHLAKMMENNPKMRVAYSRPSVNTDKFYENDGARVTWRKNRLDENGGLDTTPHIHYGLIASGSQVIKSTSERARLRKDADILCVEMEAAGLMNNIPCLVIRGICDYADSRKNDDWQRYAASTAAAYTRELLDTVAPAASEEVDVSGPIAKDIMDSYFRWLQPVNSTPLLKEARGKRTPTTGHWFIENEFKAWMAENSFLWLYGKAGCGKTILSSTIISEVQKEKSGDLAYFYFSFRDHTANCGPRQFLSSILVQLVRARVVLASQSPLLYRLPQAFQKLCNNNLLDGDPEVETILQVILDVLSDSRTTSIVVDALDECQSHQHRGQILNFLKQIFRESASPLRILVTSRREPDIQATMMDTTLKPLVNAVPLQTKHADDDIKTHLETRMKAHPFSQWSNPMKKLVLATLSEQSNGVFRYAECQLRSLEPCLRESDVRTALQHLPDDLDEIYSRILEKIDQSHYAKEAYTTLVWLMHSTRPLTLRELGELAAFSVQEETNNEYQPVAFSPADRFMSPNILRHLLSELVVATGEDTQLVESLADTSLSPAAELTEQGDSMAARQQKAEPQPDAVIQLSHFSVKEYLSCNRVSKRWRITAAVAHRFLVESSLIYIAFCEKDSQSPDYSDDHYPLLQHACQSWPFYMRKTCEAKSTNAHTERLLLDLFDKRDIVYKFALRRGFTRFVLHGKLYENLLLRPGKTKQSLHLFENEDMYCSPLYFLTLLDLADGIRLLTESLPATELRLDIEYQEEAPLHIATQHNRKDAVKLLLGHGANIHETGLQKRSTLHYAASSGNVPMIQVILEHSPGLIHAVDNAKETALHHAVRCGNVDAAVFLARYDSGKIRECRNVFGLTAVQLAIRTLTWHPTNAISIVEALVGIGADVNVQALSGRTLIEEAAICNKILDIQRNENFATVGFGNSVPEVPGPEQLGLWYRSGTTPYSELLKPLYAALLHALWCREVPVPIPMKMAAYQVVVNAQTDDSNYYQQTPYKTRLILSAEESERYFKGQQIYHDPDNRVPFFNGRQIYLGLQAFLARELEEINSALAAMANQDDAAEFFEREKAHFTHVAGICSYLCGYFTRHWIGNSMYLSPIKNVRELCMNVWETSVAVPFATRGREVEEGLNEWVVEGN